MAGPVELSTGIPSGPGFFVSHQKLELDIDFATKTLRGKTEIIVHPTRKELKVLRLNCRQCVLKRLNINGKPPTIKYQEPYDQFRIPGETNVHQYHQLRQKLSAQLKEPPEEELTINLPKSVRIEDVDPLGPEANHFAGKLGGTAKRNSEDAGAPTSAQAPRSAEEHVIRYKPLTIYLEFVTETFRDGLQFVGWEDGDLRYPHVYTRNSAFPGSACCVFPCVDDLSARCTWEISIRCPRTLEDAFRHIQRSPEFRPTDARGDDPRRLGASGRGKRSASVDIAEEDSARDIEVICSGELDDEVIDPVDRTKKVVSFLCTNVVAARHIGFAIGPFEYIDLSDFRETNEDEKLGENAIQLHGYCLPGRVEELRNTCFPTAKAIDFFTLTYGSYPYSSYAVCFVDHLSDDIVNTASVSICSNRLLFPENIIEPMDRITRQLVHALASQWIGVNILPRDPTDSWVTVGIAHFITDMFMKKLCGNNEYRYQQKKAAERVCDLDVGRPALSSLGSLLSLEPAELEFMALKASMVLFILDRRLTKASGSSGLSRIISRIFLNAKVGELANGCLTTAHFHRTCEKLGHTKLDLFFQQWVYGAGCPRFIITQRFNKKKLVVEMLIRQVQADQSTTQNLDTNHFMRDVKEELYKASAEPVQPVFTGPMTIRIHEADGTPYEHIVEIREASTKFEIPYNTKYKRLKRSRRQKERAAATSGVVEVSAETQDDVLLYCLGDVLQSEEEVRSWRLADWTRDDEDKMSQESYEWIRIDADFEWICKISITMPGYMFLSQLQQDRDVVAQYESLQYIAAQKETALVSTILVRTLLDKRYFHRIRTAAAHALAKCGKDELEWIGLFHLKKAFQEFFCYPDSPMTRTNDFSDRTAYYIQCAIPQAMAKVRDHDGRVPLRAREFLFDLLKFNDNSNNEFSDCHYLATIMTALGDALIPVSSSGGIIFSVADEEEDEQEKRFLAIAINEIDRFRRMDEWILSYQNVLTTTALRCRRHLIKAGLLPRTVADFIRYTRPGCYDPLRVSACGELIEMGMLKQNATLRYVLLVLGEDPSPYVRDQLRRLFIKGLAAIAVGEVEELMSPQEGLIIEQEATTGHRQAELARKQTVKGALAALKKEMGDNDALKRSLWAAVTSPMIGLFEMRDLLDLCSLLFEPKTSLTIKLCYPRYWKVQHLGHGKLLFQRSEKIRTKPLAARVRLNQRSASVETKTEEKSRGGPVVPKITLKHKRSTSDAQTSAQTSAQTPAQTPAPTSAQGSGTNAQSSSSSQPDPKRLKLKLNFGKK